MLLQRSKLAAANIKRVCLVSPLSIGVLSTLVVAVLVAIYPYQDLLKRVLEAPQSELTDIYLHNLLRTDLDNPRLGLLLAQYQLNRGLYDELKITLARLLQSPDTDIRYEAVWLGWLADEQNYLKLDPASPERKVRLAALLDHLRQIAVSTNVENSLIEIARSAISYGDTTLIMQIFKRLEAIDSGCPAAWYATAGRSAVAAGDYAAAGRFYLIAAQRASEPIQQRRYFLDAMYALQAGDRVSEALSLAETELAATSALADSTEVLEVLVRFARSIRRPDLADRYARMLLKLTLLLELQQRQWARTYADSYRVTGLSLRRVADETVTGKGPKLPFNDRIYTLGFEAFLDNKNLEDAWQVAAAAVRQAPANIAWRERLARVSEWSGRQTEALPQWLYVAQHSNSEEAWQALLRLGPGLMNDGVVVLALEHRLSRYPNDEALIKQLVGTRERLGQPNEAIAFLERLQHAQPQAERWAQMAELAERAGDDARALALWQRFLNMQKPTTTQAMHIAVLRLTRNDATSALATLENVTDAGSANGEYWRLLGVVAAELGNDSKAVAAYRHLLTTDQANANDYIALTDLLTDNYALDAAHVSGEGWRRFRDQRQLQLALNLYAGAARWPEVGWLLNSVTAEEISQFRRHADFLSVSARYHLATGEHALARTEIDTALAMPNLPLPLAQALLWLLIDSADGERLRQLMAIYESEWQSEPIMHDALAAAWQALSLPDVALRRYLTPRLTAHQNDFLWLMNYADALEQNQQADRAWRLRRQLM